MEKRICYFGTRGRAGHFAYPIVGSFTREELKSIDKIDNPVYHEAMKKDGFIYELHPKSWTQNFLGSLHYGTLDNFMYYAIPCSKDDKRPGCISAIFVEFATSSNDIREAILSDCELRWRFDKRYPKEDEI